MERNEVINPILSTVISAISGCIIFSATGRPDTAIICGFSAGCISFGTFKVCDILNQNR
jgi:hypothetical protein